MDEEEARIRFDPRPSNRESDHASPPPRSYHNHNYSSSTATGADSATSSTVKRRCFSGGDDGDESKRCSSFLLDSTDLYDFESDQ